MASQPKEPVDDFDAAFASFAADGKPPVDAGEPADDEDPGAGNADAGAAAADAGDAGDTGADDAGGDGDDAPGGDAGDGGSDGEGQHEDAGEDEPATDDLIQRLARLVKEAPAADDKPAAATEATPEPVQDIYSADEVDFLKTYDADWGDVAKGEALKRRAEYRELVGHVFKEVAAQLQPLMQQVDVMATRTHLGDLREKVADYDVVRDKVVSWVDQQPKYLQKAYKEVIQVGTADEVADLIERYRQSTGDASQLTPKPANKKVVELSDDAKKAAGTLAPVNTKRSAVPQSDDPQDFDAAFAKFAAGQST